MIKFGIRQSFDSIEQVENRYANLTVPVEVALPYYWDIYEPVRGRWEFEGHNTYFFFFISVFWSMLMNKVMCPE